MIRTFNLAGWHATQATSKAILMYLHSNYTQILAYKKKTKKNDFSYHKMSGTSICSLICDSYRGVMCRYIATLESFDWSVNFKKQKGAILP